MGNSKKDLIEIDGSYGEGGGQILRTSLALSAVLKVPVRIHHIRAGRKKPGILPQHLQGAYALAQITQARLEGLQIGSQSVSFSPQTISAGKYRFEVGTAGSVMLVLQTVLLPLISAEERSEITLAGGTHVPWSPPFHYTRDVLIPTLNKIGVRGQLSIEKWGWYPRGGGEVRVQFEPAHKLSSAVWVERGSLKRIHGISATSQVPEHVGERMKRQALERIEGELAIVPEIGVLHNVPSNGPGAFMILVAESKGAIAGFSALGKRGKSAEDVAEEAVDGLKEYVESGGCLDPHLADQVVPFLVLTKAPSIFTVSRITEHLMTNLWVIRQFLDVEISIQGEKGRSGKIGLFNRNG